MTETDLEEKYTQIKGNTVQEQLKSRNTKADADEQAVTKEEQQCSAWIGCRSNLNHCIYFLSLFFFFFLLLNK